MGGDRAPEVVITGAEQAHARFPHVRFLLFGDAARLEPLLARAPKLKPVAEIRHTADVVAADEKPSLALRRGRNSSMRLAIDAVASGEAGGVVSAGNTGALMATAKFVLKTLPGIDRPAITSFFPSERGEIVMLDLGANVECDADNLVQFAVMGANFAHSVLGRFRPTVGLLNVGVEEVKGHEALKTAAEKLRATPGLAFDFAGFVEGDDIGRGVVDVIVTDGFTGNIALKTAEGTARLVTGFVRTALSGSWAARLGYLLARRRLQAVRDRLDPRLYNGGVFLGLNGIVVKSHGGTDTVGFAAAIELAVDMVADRLTERITADFQRFLAVVSNASPQSAAATVAS